MKRLTLLLLIIMSILFMGSTTFAGTTVYRFTDEPFDNTKCFETTDMLPGPATEFGQDVCVHYQALGSETVRFKNHRDGTMDVSWNLIRHGTATIISWSTGEVLYVGPFQHEEIGRDDGNDAGCVAPDGRVWLENCSDYLMSLDYLLYHKKITGNKVSFFKAIIKEPGMLCRSYNGGEGVGPGCK